MQGGEDALPASVLETALIGRHPHIGFWRWESHADVALARRALKAVALDGLEQRPQNHLSGGERRRLAIATVLAQDPQVFLLDEPANELDLHFQLHLVQIFQRLAYEQDRAVIMSLHDVNLAARFCDTLLLLFGDGEARWGRSADLLTPKLLERLYRTPVERVAWREGDLFVPVSESRIQKTEFR
jgi:iron complex transport system ATP-binding protein